MKRQRMVFLILGLLLAAAASSLAFAQAGRTEVFRGRAGPEHFHPHGGVRGGVIVSGPRFWPAYPVYPPPLVLPPSFLYPGPYGNVPFYVQRAGPPVGYYCAWPGGYFPNVQQCPGGWSLVNPPMARQ